MRIALILISMLSLVSLAKADSQYCKLTLADTVQAEIWNKVFESYEEVERETSARALEKFRMGKEKELDRQARTLRDHPHMIVAKEEGPEIAEDRPHAYHITLCYEDEKASPGSKRCSALDGDPTVLFEAIAAERFKVEKVRELGRSVAIVLDLEKSRYPFTRPVHISVMKKIARMPGEYYLLMMNALKRRLKGTTISFAGSIIDCVAKSGPRRDAAADLAQEDASRRSVAAEDVELANARGPGPGRAHGRGKLVGKTFRAAGDVDASDEDDASDDEEFLTQGYATKSALRRHSFGVGRGARVSEEDDAWEDALMRRKSEAAVAKEKSDRGRYSHGAASPREKPRKMRAGIDGPPPAASFSGSSPHEDFDEGADVLAKYGITDDFIDSLEDGVAAAPKEDIRAPMKKMTSPFAPLPRDARVLEEKRRERSVVSHEEREAAAGLKAETHPKEEDIEERSVGLASSRIHLNRRAPVAEEEEGGSFGKRRQAKKGEKPRRKAEGAENVSPVNVLQDPLEDTKADISNTLKKKLRREAKKEAARTAQAHAVRQ